MKKPGTVGVIAGLSYQFGSGIATILFKDGTHVYVESGTGLRALADCFGAHEGSGDLVQKIHGKKIRYGTDEMGLGVMEWFTPVGRRKDKS